MRIPEGGGGPPGRGGRVTPNAVTPGTRVAVRLHVTGVVQGVGLRPYVYRLATRLGLAGVVRNRVGEVEIDLEGGPADLEAFTAAFVTSVPRLARIEQITREPLAPTGTGHFVIAASECDSSGSLPVSPDSALCPGCEAELFDPANRRYHYPFMTCTDCGPRYTIIHRLPYDRERTSMSAFTACPECAREYRTPGDRRYHCETNSCPGCGPRLWLAPGRMSLEGTEGDPLAAAARALRAGWIVALRGLGGFHLAADATNERAVRRLRRLKGREAKPLAVMVRTLNVARRVARVLAPEAQLLMAPERPVVLLQRRAGTRIAAAVAPGLDTIGVMLPYTALHRLLLEVVRRPLVMTSGNASDEPIAITNQEASTRLSAIADLLLLHDREILARYDDSVIRVTGAGPVVVRRARGYAPLPLRLPIESPRRLVAVGAELKNSFTLVSGRNAYLSQHIGDLTNVETLDHFEVTLDQYRRLFQIDPDVVARDRHPDYLSTRYAERMGLTRIIAVQHHHAHVAAVMAEHGVETPVIGIAYDGTGYGDDGAIWGSEILLADLSHYRRMAHLRYAPLPGGDAAARRPWRSALGYLSLEPALQPPEWRTVTADERQAVQWQLAADVNSPPASSMGRLFDAVAALLDVRAVQYYEGQAAMELEALAGRRAAAELLQLPVVRGSDGGRLLDPVPMLASLIELRNKGVDPGDLAAGFHEAVAVATATVVADLADETGTRTAVLSGGVFQNARLLQSVYRRLKAAGLRVLIPRRLSPNDGAVSFGQAAVAAEILRRELEGD